MPSLTPRSPHAPLTTRLFGVLPIAIAVALSGCSSSGTVNTDFDRTANFSALRTYSWRGGTRLPNPLMEQRIVNAVDEQLRAKGFTRVDNGGDLTVTYHASANRQLDVQTFESGGPYRCWGGCTASTTVRPVTVGTLVVDLVDTKTDRLLWRGTGTNTVTGDPADTEKKINQGVKKMFESFPPKA